jgi:hypothetical protein
VIKIIKNHSYLSDYGYWVTECGIKPKIKGVYILNKTDIFGLTDVLYVGKGRVRNRINNDHSKKNSKNSNWTNGFVIECNNRLLRSILEKLLIHILKPKNNKIIPKIHHLILSELIATDSSGIYQIIKEYND